MRILGLEISPGFFVAVVATPGFGSTSSAGSSAAFYGGFASPVTQYSAEFSALENAGYGYAPGVYAQLPASAWQAACGFTPGFPAAPPPGCPATHTEGLVPSTAAWTPFGMNSQEAALLAQHGYGNHGCSG